ncbi:MAG: hypothetical protein WBS33_01605, partial [Verrucomicrobiia bacterium]
GRRAHSLRRGVAATRLSNCIVPAKANPTKKIRAGPHRCAKCNKEFTIRGGTKWCLLILERVIRAYLIHEEYQDSEKDF